MGLKTDAVPGRLNETWVNVKEPGTYAVNVLKFVEQVTVLCL